MSAASVSSATYAWRISGNSNVLSTSQTYSVSPSSTTTYELTVSVNHGGTICSSTDDVIVTVNSLPNVSVNEGSSLSVHEGDGVTLTGSGATTYSWDNGVTNGTPFAAPGITTVYTVTGTDDNNCSNTDQITLNVTSQISWANLQWPPTATFSCDGGFCWDLR